MKVIKYKKGLYVFFGTKLADMVIVEYDEETKFWYAFDLESGKPVVDCDRNLCNIINEF